MSFDPNEENQSAEQYGAITYIATNAANSVKHHIAIGYSFQKKTWLTRVFGLSMEKTASRQSPAKITAVGARLQYPL